VGARGLYVVWMHVFGGVATWIVCMYVYVVFGAACGADPAVCMLVLVQCLKR